MREMLKGGEENGMEEKTNQQSDDDEEEEERIRKEFKTYLKTKEHKIVDHFIKKTNNEYLREQRKNSCWLCNDQSSKQN